MRPLWLGTSWKMHKTIGEAQLFAESLRSFFAASQSVSLQLFIMPPFTALFKVCEVLRDTTVLVGAQNMHWERSGAYTGEISPLMVRDCGAQLVELGHSERRESFGETDYTVNRKVLSALAHGLRPIVCVGETPVEKECGAAHVSVARQVRMALNGVAIREVPRVIFAYEPVWAIGEAGMPAEPSHADSVHACIRKAIGDAGERSTILYGGSVSQQNAVDFVAQPNVDGLFIGRAAWDASDFVELVRLIMVSPRPENSSRKHTADRSATGESG